MPPNHTRAIVKYKNGLLGLYIFPLPMTGETYSFRVPFSNKKLIIHRVPHHKHIIFKEE